MLYSKKDKSDTNVKINTICHDNDTNLVHQNIQGILNKDLEIKLFLHTNNIHVLCITEHWLWISEAIFNFTDHQVASMFHREKAIRCGSLIILNKSYKFKERKDIVSLSVEQTIGMACAELEHFIVVSVLPRGIWTLWNNFITSTCKINSCMWWL